VSEQDFGGFTRGRRLGVGFFGAIHEGSSQRGQEARILVVSEALASHPEFEDALLHFGRALALIDCEQLVATRAVGKTADGTLFVVQEALESPVSLDEILLDGGEALGPDLGLGIARAVVDGLAKLHEVGLTHGAVHPRSIWITAAGRVCLGECAVARALAAAAVATPALLEGLDDFLAPEVRDGHEAAAGSDVFAVGQVIDLLGLGNDDMAPVVRRAVASAPHDRFADGPSLKRALDGAVRAGRFSTAERNALAELGRPKGTPIARLPSVESSAQKPPPSKPATPKLDLDDALDSLGDDLDEEQTLDPASVAGALRAASAPLPSASTAPPGASDEGGGRRFPRAKPKAVAPIPEADEPSKIVRARELAEAKPLSPSLVEPETGELTAVEEMDALLGADPMDEIIGLGPAGGASEGERPDVGSIPDFGMGPAGAPLSMPRREPSELPLPTPPPELTEPAADVAAGAERALAALDDLEDEEAEDERLDELPTLATPRSVVAEARAKSAASAASPPPPPEESPRPAAPAPAAPPAAALATEPQAVPALFDDSDLLAANGLKKGRGVWWMAATVVVVGSAFGYVYTQTDVFHPERARAKAERRERERIAEEERLRAQLDKPGTVVINSEVQEAAVWLLLGRTPLDTFRLPASAIADLRFEHEGYKSIDLPVTGPMWTEGDGELRAGVHARLEPGDLDAPLPAYPKAPDPEPPPGPAGQGVVHVESTPPGAQVWLLVGFTPKVSLTGMVAGKTYEFKVLKEGYRPAYAEFKDSQWYLSGEPGVGKVKPELEQTVALEALGKGHGKPKP